MAGPTVGKAFVEVRPDLEGFGKDLSKAVGPEIDQGMKSVSSSVSTTTKAMDVGLKAFFGGLTGALLPSLISGLQQAGQAIVDFGAQAIQMGSDAEESASAFGTVFGDSTDQLQRFVDEFANTAGFTEAELQGLLATTGNVVKGIGGTEEAAADLGQTLAETAADVASFTNAEGGAEAVLGAFQSALTGERDALKTYGIVISEAEVQQRALNDSGKESVDQLSRLDKAYATTALIIERAGDAVGDLSRTSDGAANTQRRLSARFRELQTSIGQQLLPVWSDVLEAVEDALPAIENVGTGFANFATSTLPILVDALTTATDAFATFLGVATVDIESEFASQSSVVNQLVRDYGSLDKNLAILISTEEMAVDSGNALGSSQDFTRASLVRLHEQLGVSDEMWEASLEAMIANADALGLTDEEVNALTSSLESSRMAGADNAMVTEQMAMKERLLARETKLAAEATEEAEPAVTALKDARREARIQTEALELAEQRLADTIRASADPVFAAVKAQQNYEEVLAQVESGELKGIDASLALAEANLDLNAAVLELDKQDRKDFFSNLRAGLSATGDLTEEEVNAVIRDLREELRLADEQTVQLDMDDQEVIDAREELEKVKVAADDLNGTEVQIGINTTFRTFGTPVPGSSTPGLGEEVAGLVIGNAALSTVQGVTLSLDRSQGNLGQGGVTVINTFNAPVGGSMADFSDEIMRQAAIELRFARA